MDITDNGSGKLGRGYSCDYNHPQRIPAELLNFYHSLLTKERRALLSSPTVTLVSRSHPRYLGMNLQKKTRPDLQSLSCV